MEKSRILDFLEKNKAGSFYFKAQEEQLPVAISNSAGLYVCNRVYYEALYQHQRTIFIHIPRDFTTQVAANIITAIAIGKF